MEEVIDIITQSGDMKQLQREWGKRHLNVIDFTQILLVNVNPTPQQALTFGQRIISIYSEISVSQSHSNPHSQGLTFSQFSEYLITNYANQSPTTLYQKKIPMYIHEEYRLFAEPPVVVQEHEPQKVRVLMDPVCNDRKSHGKKKILRAEVTKMGKIICLYETTDHLLVYDSNCAFLCELNPQSRQDLMRTFKWSQKQKTIGALLKKGVCFWSEKEDFKFWHVVHQEDVDHIDYIESLGIWVLISFSTGKVLEFDLSKELVLNQFSPNKLSAAIITHRPKSFIEIKYASLFGIACGHELYFIHFRKKQITFVVTLATNIRSISYSDSYHMLFLASFDLKASLYSLNLCFCDFEEKESRIASKGLISLIAHKPNSEVVLTFDDLKVLKLWNIKEMTCYQSFTYDISVMIPVDAKLIVIGVYVVFFKFKAVKQEPRETVTCLETSSQYLFVSTANKLRYYNWSDGKLARVVETVFKKQEIAHLSVDRVKTELVLVGDGGTIQRRSIPSSEVVFEMETDLMEDYQYDHNTRILATSGKRLVLSFFQQELKPVRAIKLDISVYSLNTYSGIMGFLHQSCVYVVKYSSMTLTHLIEVPKSQKILKIIFVEGSRVMLLVEKHNLEVLLLGSEGTCPSYSKVDWGIPKDSAIEVIGQPESVFSHPFVESIGIYIGTQSGAIHKMELKGLHFQICQSSIKQTSQSLEYKEIITSFNTLLFNFGYQRICLEKMARNRIQSEKREVQTKLKSIRFIDVKEHVVVSNLTRVMVYSKNLELMGEVCISKSFPLVWFSSATSQESNTRYPEKLLHHLGHSAERITTKPSQRKRFITQEELQQKRESVSNLFKSKSKIRMFQKDSEKVLSERKPCLPSDKQKPHPKTDRLLTSPSSRQKTFSRQKIMSEKLQTSLSKTIQSSKRLKGSRMLLLDGKPKSAMNLINNLESRLKMSRIGDRVVTEPHEPLPSILSRGRKDN